MNKEPSDPSLPFFAYGIFNLGQLAFRKIADLVESIDETATIQGSLYAKEGLPLLRAGTSGSIRGGLIRFTVGNNDRAYAAVNELEPGHLYKWREMEVQTKSGSEKAQVLVGRKPEKGSLELVEIKDWRGEEDPLFSSALDVIEETLKQNSKFEWDLKPLFRLEMAYLLLWSCIERYAAFTYSLGNNVSEKNNALGEESAFADALKKYVKEPRILFRSDKYDEKCELNPELPYKSIRYYYQIRCNLTHRGKAAESDHDRLRLSLEELLHIFKHVLKSAFLESKKLAEEKSMR